MQVVILAGGLGTRLRPITEKVPKPMVEVHDRPFLSYQIDLFKSQGFTDFLILAGYLGEKIESYFGDGTRFGVHIEYSFETNGLQGTGGALKLAEDKLQESFVLVFGDSFLPIDYNSLVDVFRINPERLGVLVAYDNTKEHTDVQENLEVRDGKILRYLKGVEDPNLNYVEAGAMVFSKQIVSLISKNTVVSLEEKIYPILISRGLLSGYITDTRFYDIGTFDRLKVFDTILSTQ